MTDQTRQVEGDSLAVSLRLSCVRQKLMAAAYRKPHVSWALGLP